MDLDQGGRANPTIAVVAVVSATAAVVLFLGFAGLGSMALLDADEGRHAEIARGALDSQRAWPLRFAGESYAEKPPGLYWVLAASFATFGTDEWSARLPSAISGVGVVAATSWLAARAFGPSVGVAAALMLATTMLHLVLSRLLLLDMAFTVFLWSAVACLGAWLDDRSAPPPKGIWILLAGAVWIKGPVALVLFAAALSLYGLATRNRRLAIELRLERAAVVLALAVGVPGAILWLASADEITTFLWRSNVQRFFGWDRVGDPESIVYFAVVLPAVCLPWSVLWPGLAAERRRPEGSVVSTWLLCWSVAVVGFFSLSRSKLPSYILPAVPAIAILTSRAFVAAARRGHWERPALLRAGAWTLAAVVAIGPPVAVFFLPDDLAPARAVILSISLTGTVALAAVWMASSPLKLFAANVALSLAIGGLFLGRGDTLLERYKSRREPARLIEREVGARGRLLSYHFRSNTLRFYARRPVERAPSLAAVGAALSSPEPIVAALRTWDRRELSSVIEAPVHLWWLDWPTRRMIVSNRPPRTTPSLWVFHPKRARAALDPNDARPERERALVSAKSLVESASRIEHSRSKLPSVVLVGPPADELAGLGLRP